MEIFGIFVSFKIIFGSVGLFLIVGLWKLGNQGRGRVDPNKQWSPDTDPTKKEILTNIHQPGPR